MPVTSKFKKGQHVWYYCSGYNEPREFLYISLIYDCGWNGRCKVTPIEGGEWQSRHEDFLFATEVEAHRAKAEWLREYIQEQQKVIDDAKTKIVLANEELFEVTRKMEHVLTTHGR